MDVGSHLEVELLGYVQVEVALKRQVVGVALVVLAAVVAQVGRVGQPRLEVGALLVCLERLRGLERHLVDLLVRRNEEEVVARGSVAVDVAAVEH